MRVRKKKKWAEFAKCLGIVLTQRAKLPTTWDLQAFSSFYAAWTCQLFGLRMVTTMGWEAAGPSSQSPLLPVLLAYGALDTSHEAPGGSPTLVPSQLCGRSHVAKSLGLTHYHLGSDLLRTNNTGEFCRPGSWPACPSSLSL